VGTYDRLRNHDQQEIVKLREKISVQSKKRNFGGDSRYARLLYFDGYFLDEFFLKPKPIPIGFHYPEN
jgi:hypothetical protein